MNDNAGQRKPRPADVQRQRYVHVDDEGAIRSGRSSETIEVLEDGRLRIHEDWQWESEPGSGTSVLEESTAGSAPRLD